jgi:deoxyribonuclease-4
MPILGAHMSISGGHFKAVEAARRCNCDCVQLFSKNNSQWRAKAISDKDAAQFRAALRKHKISHPLVHSSYLINLASPDRKLWKRSLDALVAELSRAAQLGIPYVVLHPGCFTSASEARGLKNVMRALDEADRRTAELDVACLLETTAGQGTQLGWRFEQLAMLLDGVEHGDRLGVCFDTCHVFAAGYPMVELKQYRATMRQFNKTVGVSRIKAIHLNDSRRPLGSRIDRHEHIGKGCLGLAPFRHLLNDRRFRKTPMYLETPKGRRRGVDWDVFNLRTLRKLVQQ